MKSYDIKFIKDSLLNNIIDNDHVIVYEDGSMYTDVILEENKVSGVPLDSNEASAVVEVLNDTNIELNEYYNIDDLSRLMTTLDRVYQDTVTLPFDKYVIGSNNYFVYACPKRLAYDKNGRNIIHFNMPDVNDPDVIEYGQDDHTTPIYTNGEFDKYDNTLIKLDECKMEFMGEFEYTNPSGYTETYVMWKTNGFFTRKYDDYEFNMSIKSEEDFINTGLPTVIEDNKIDPIENTLSTEENSTNNTSESIRIVNTASPTGSDINDNIVFIDTLLL